MCPFPTNGCWTPNHIPLKRLRGDDESWRFGRWRSDAYDHWYYIIIPTVLFFQHSFASAVWAPCVINRHSVTLPAESNRGIEQMCQFEVHVMEAAILFFSVYTQGCQRKALATTTFLRFVCVSFRIHFCPLSMTCMMSSIAKKKSNSSLHKNAKYLANWHDVFTPLGSFHLIAVVVHGHPQSSDCDRPVGFDGPQAPLV